MQEAIERGIQIMTLSVCLCLRPFLQTKILLELKNGHKELAKYYKNCKFIAYTWHTTRIIGSWYKAICKILETIFRFDGTENKWKHMQGKSAR